MWASSPLTVSEPASSSVCYYDDFTILSDDPSGVDGPARGGTDRSLSVARNPVQAGEPIDLEFVTPRPGRVTLRIFDATGSLVANMLDRELPAGTHTCFWNGLLMNGSRRAPAGQYFIALTDREARSLSRGILLR